MQSLDWFHVVLLEDFEHMEEGYKYAVGRNNRESGKIFINAKYETADSLRNTLIHELLHDHYSPFMNKFNHVIGFHQDGF